MGTLTNVHAIRLFSAQDRLVHKARNTPARLWRMFLLNSGVTFSEFSTRMENYLVRKEQYDRTLPENDGKDLSKNRSSTRGNYLKALADDEMSWKMLDIGMGILHLKAWTISIQGHFDNGRIAEAVDYLSGDEDDEVIGEESKPEDNMSQEEEGMIFQGILKKSAEIKHEHLKAACSPTVIKS